MKKSIPYGVSNYAELVGGEYYYVDKTWVIRELERYKSPLFLRPRRFGKTLLCSMLEYYYDAIYADRFNDLFGMTDIGRNPTGRHNQYNVIHLDFSPVCLGKDVAEIEKNFDKAVFGQLDDILFDHGIPAGTLQSNESGSESLRQAISLLRQKKNSPAYIIIDEYDNFTNQLIQSNRDSLYYAATGQSEGQDGFLKAFFKKIKEYVARGTAAGCFLTGVLPVTLDDLTSGFNIAKNITLHPQFHDAMGFTEEEIRTYTGEIFGDYGTPGDVRQTVLEDLRNYYDGYRMLPDAPHHLYNSTICNNYLDDFVKSGEIPTRFQDSNVKLDIGWLKRLAGSSAAANEFIGRLATEGRMTFYEMNLDQQFNLASFLAPEQLASGLFFLGQLTWGPGRDELVFPNLTVKLLFIRVFNDLNAILPKDDALHEAFLAYERDGDFARLFSCYWSEYVGHFPAACFGNVRECFFQMTFYYYCLLFMRRGMHPMIEENVKTGRADLTFEGVDNMFLTGRAVVVEFKHLKGGESMPESPLASDVAQACGYAADKRRKLGRPVLAYLVYTRANHDQKVFFLQP